jgi:hypothetical protein
VTSVTIVAIGGGGGDGGGGRAKVTSTLTVSATQTLDLFVGGGGGSAAGGGAGGGSSTIDAGATDQIIAGGGGGAQWDASYSGDSNNNGVSDNGAANERVTVDKATTSLWADTSIVLRYRFAMVTFTATLTDQDTDHAIGGQTITFTIGDDLGSCEAETNGGGVATCSVQVTPWQRLSPARPYTAVYSGTTQFDATTVTGDV